MEHPNKGYIFHKTNLGDTPLQVEDFCVIGRSPDCQLRIDASELDEKHARIERRNNRFFIRDMRTVRGTSVNGVQILEALLADGDIIKLGSHELVFSFSRPDRETQNILSSNNPDWQSDLQRFPAAARSNLPVLLLGSSGTGKERLAELIHKMSPRRHMPFVSVNCSAMSESLIESELFGHVKGSFTGATHDRKGAFEAARGGTLFLDEIGDFPLNLQPKLLRALENQQIRPVGSDRVIETDVRIVAATHHRLTESISAGTFRTDLYFRLHVIRINVPNLRERPEDFDRLLFNFARDMRVRFTTEAIEVLKAHPWPGNIRELKNAVSRASALFAGEEISADMVCKLIDPIYIDATTTPSNVAANSKPIIREIERDLIVKRLIANRCNQRKTATDLGLPKSTLHDRIKTYGISLDDIKSQLHA